MSIFIWLKNKIFGETKVWEDVAEDTSSTESNVVKNRDALENILKDDKFCTEFEFYKTLYKSWSDDIENWKILNSERRFSYTEYEMGYLGIRIKLVFPNKYEKVSPDSTFSNVESTDKFGVVIGEGLKTFIFDDESSFYLIVKFVNEFLPAKNKVNNIKRLTENTRILAEITSVIKMGAANENKTVI